MPILPVSGLSLVKSLGPGRDFRNLVNYNYDETLSRTCRYLSIQNSATQTWGADMSSDPNQRSTEPPDEPAPPTVRMPVQQPGQDSPAGPPSPGQAPPPGRMPPGGTPPGRVPSSGQEPSPGRWQEPATAPAPQWQPGPPAKPQARS